MATIANLLVKLGWDGKEFNSGIDTAQGKLKDVGSKVSSVGKGMSVGITAPAVAVGAALLKIGGDADSMADSIAVATGATGEELDALTKSATNVFTSIPTSMEIAGQAIGDLSKLTGQTGKGLEDLAATEIRLAEITGSDLGTVIESTTDLFKNWQIPAEDQVATLDALMVASQATGVSVEDLSSQMQKHGATLRGMGMDTEEAIAFLGSLSKAGLDVNKTMAGLTKAYGNFAKAGKNPQEEMGKLLGSMAQAPDLATATALAVEQFGAKAGPGLAEALFNGTLGVEELLAEIQNAEGGILETAASTDDAAQQFQVLKNQVIAAAIPLGQQLFQALNDLMPTIAGLVGWLAKAMTWFANLPGPVQKVIFIVVALAAALGPILMIVGPLIPLIGTLTAILPALGAAFTIATGPIGIIIVVLAALFLAWKTNFLGIQDITDKVIGTIISIFERLVGWFTGGGLSGIMDSFIGTIQAIWDYILLFLEFYVTLPITIAEILIDVVESASGFAEDFIGQFAGIAEAIAKPFADIFNVFFNAGYSIVGGLINGIASLWNDFVAWADKIISKAKSIIDWINPGSPSKTFTPAARSIIESFVTEFSSGASDVGRAADKVSDAMTFNASTAHVPGSRSAAGVASNAGGTVFDIDVHGVNDPNAVADVVMSRILRATSRVAAGGVA